jgi:hypothetical protein
MPFNTDDFAKNYTLMLFELDFKINDKMDLKTNHDIILFLIKDGCEKSVL